MRCELSERYGRTKDNAYTNELSVLDDIFHVLTLTDEVGVTKGINIKKKALKGTKDHFELAGGSSYGGFKLLGVKITVNI